VQRCADFLDAVPEGTIVTISVYGSVGAEISSNYAAMQSLGGKVIDIGQQNCYAMVGQKGWKPGSAVEAVEEIGDTLVWAMQQMVEG
jgi:hypothetical protein